MLRYISRSGEELTRKEWQRLYRDPAYERLALMENDRGRVLASWIGLAMSQERNPAVFLVQLFTYGPRATIKEQRHEWVTTERQALTVFEVYERELVG